MISTTEFEVVYEDPSNLLKGFEMIKNYIDSLNCLATKSSAWAIASCEDIFIKAKIDIEESLNLQTITKASINVKLEGNTNEIVKMTSELTKIIRDSGGGIILRS
ncbi:hypothetical protein Calag_0507 [Caldisphaera lagunensis DSM 15908]|uniref:Uncharacterized protein n=1 Tax=Caldisphaera lagunensis (strain DSM 15908 / JCM 11604 / ANMR 0165 / IC-154) TaxID=1056495 RepID=L0A8U4_CALLD|nr:hypothetical protein [Caldisphaera lagunensis]AFZ70271.1 hypothetical protein Calag_0507 [Caldisphaera lagunensis DSM 15908]